MLLRGSMKSEVATDGRTDVAVDEAACLELLEKRLLSAGTIDPQALDRAKRAAAKTGERFDLALVKLGILSEVEVAKSLANVLGVSLFSPTEQIPERILPEVFSASFVQSNRVLPLRMDRDTLCLAVVDPFDTLPIKAVRHVSGKNVICELAASADFDRVARALYPETGNEASDTLPTLEDATVEPSDYDLQRLRDSASGAPVIKLVNQVIASAVDARASDVHLESTRESLVVRYRIDGHLRTADTISHAQRAAVISRFKIMAKLDIAERRLPQDGRLKLAFRGNEIDFRISTIPTTHGESIVVRILDKTRIDLDFVKLGLLRSQIEQIERLLTNANGIVLVTGPTGSGKTTTLYTMLRQVNQPSVKIFTVEDPVEYQLDGINQVAVQPAIGLDFPACLRSILRQDPDLIMVGEVRDAETARIAVQASLTGHLVLCTIHTNSASATITRLMDMGIEHFLIGSTVKGIVAQRLVRRLCPSCATPHAKAQYWINTLTSRVPQVREYGPPNIKQAVGCSSCSKTGYMGRLTIAEILVVGEAVQDCILHRANVVELAATAQKAGMIPMQQDGLIKAWQGLTTVEDVLRATEAG